MNIFTKNKKYYSSKSCKFVLLFKFVIFVFLLQVIPASAATYGQKLNINKQNITLKEFFKEIKIQTNYDVLWEPYNLDNRWLIKGPIINESLSDALKKHLNGEQLTFEIEQNTVIVKKYAQVAYGSQDSLVVKGQVIDERGKGMAGATVRIKGTNKVTKTESSGYFAIFSHKKGTLLITFLGYVNKEVSLSGLTLNSSIKIGMIPGQNQLGEVAVVSSGYQDLPKERATGSFEVITKEQLQHSSDPNLLKRLEGITTAVDFNNPKTPTNSALKINRQPILNNITIRGKNTLLFTNSEDNLSGVPLVVIDGIASPYSIDQLNPNDVESVTILKDAASASIWGSRAANGVIVVKTKKAMFNRPVSISFNSNFNISEKFNLFYKKYMSTSDFIDALVLQYRQQYDPADPNAYIIDPYPDYPGFPQSPTPSPVVEIVNSQKMGRITITQMNDALDALRKNDIRNDFSKYILRNPSTQSYSLSIDGGSAALSQRLSVAYDKTFNNTVNSDNNRLSINYNNSYRPLKNLELSTNVTYNDSRSSDQAGQNEITAATNNTFFPFTRLVDDFGAPIAIPKKYRPSYIDLLNRTYGNKILDMTYVPLDDINQGYFKTKSENLNLNLNAKYQFGKVISVSGAFNHNFGYGERVSLYRQDSYYMRELINIYTSTDGTRNIPLGGEYQPNVIKSNTQTIRAQINAEKNWNDKHQISAIAGVDLSESYALTRSDQYYGYDESSLLYRGYKLNYNLLQAPLIGDPSTGGSSYSLIPYSYSLTDLRTKTFSLYSNAAYTYMNKYTISGSVRKDLDSQFGLGTNKGGTPFYSVGGKWNISNENFYHINWLPNLQLRSTFGYNGNVNPIVSARPILDYPTDANSLTGLFYANTIESIGLSNKNLRPEKTGIFNVALDFGFRDNRLSGSIEYYDKKTKDLIAQSILDPTVGVSSGKINTANLHGWGSDITINSQNIQNGLFRWTTNFLFSYNRVKVTKLLSLSRNTAGYVVSNDQSFQEGEYLSRLYAFRWGGLNPNNGDPQGYLNGQLVSISANSNINVDAIANAPISSARYFGSSVPVYYGSVRNTFNYGAFSISASLLYKLGYYFRRPVSDVVRYASLFDPSQNRLQGIEYNNRWQKIGDENNTNVPSLTFPANPSRDFFYYQSEINVLKADHVRLQEINLSYAFSFKKSILKNARIYSNISNLGIIWRSNNAGLDPDIQDYPNPRTYAFGFSANF